MSFKFVSGNAGGGFPEGLGWGGAPNRVLKMVASAAGYELSRCSREPTSGPAILNGWSITAIGLDL